MHQSVLEAIVVRSVEKMVSPMKITVISNRYESPKLMMVYVSPIPIRFLLRYQQDASVDMMDVIVVPTLSLGSRSVR